MEEEHNNDLNADKESENSYLSITFRAFIVLISLILLTIVIGTSLDYLETKSYNRIDEGFYKKPIQEVLQNVIKNGGGIENVKHVYETREVHEIGFFMSFYESNEDLYSKNTSLSRILNDLLVLYYGLNQQDTIYLSNLKSIVKQYNALNPFENLDANQKYYFHNIQSKLGSQYDIIQEDVNNISHDLKTKNELVKRYLDKSEYSFYISISAIFLTILIAGYQIYASHNDNKRINEKIDSKTAELLAFFKNNKG